MNFCTSAMYHVQRPHLCAGHGQRHRPIKVGMARRQLKLRGSAGPSSRRPDTSHAIWAPARPAWAASGRWQRQEARWWAAGGAGATIRPSRASVPKAWHVDSRPRWLRCFVRVQSGPPNISAEQFIAAQFGSSGRFVLVQKIEYNLWPNVLNACACRRRVSILPA